MTVAKKAAMHELVDQLLNRAPLRPRGGQDYFPCNICIPLRRFNA